MVLSANGWWVGRECGPLSLEASCVAGEMSPLEALRRENYTRYHHHTLGRHHRLIFTLFWISSIWVTLGLSMKHGVEKRETVKQGVRDVGSQCSQGARPVRGGGNIKNDNSTRSLTSNLIFIALLGI